jgi:hypothetical protein
MLIIFSRYEKKKKYRGTKKGGKKGQREGVREGRKERRGEEGGKGKRKEGNKLKNSNSKLLCFGCVPLKIIG